jgi:cation diffusion facilitator CzcD-associated flavoprotein CzcO
MAKYMKMMAPEKYHAKLIPQFRTVFIYPPICLKCLDRHAAPGCKRLIVDPGYLKCLHRPNVTLNFDAIDRVVPEGVLLQNGEVIPLDVLIFGTGFSLVCSFDMRTAVTDSSDSCPHV